MPKRHVIKGVQGGSPGNRPEQQVVGSLESKVIWTPRVVLYTKLPWVSPDTEKNGRITVLQTGPLTRVCEQLIPTLVWGKITVQSLFNPYFTSSPSSFDISRAYQAATYRPREKRSAWP